MDENFEKTKESLATYRIGPSLSPASKTPCYSLARRKRFLFWTRWHHVSWSWHYSECLAELKAVTTPPTFYREAS